MFQDCSKAESRQSSHVKRGGCERNQYRLALSRKLCAYSIVAQYLVVLDRQGVTMIVIRNPARLKSAFFRLGSLHNDRAIQAADGRTRLAHTVVQIL